MAIGVTLVRGEGMGPEVIGAARGAIDATGVRIEWDPREIGAGAFARTGDPLPSATLDSVRANRVALKGPVETPPASGMRSVNLALRRTLDLYANIRPCRLHAGVPSLYDMVDVVVVRENTEGMYTGIELEMGTPAVEELIGFIAATTGAVVPSDSGISVKEITEHGSERIARFAFGYARANGRAKVTASHKANIMKFSHGLFLEVVRRVAQENPEIDFEDRIIDALCMQLVQAPERFDVLVLPNMYGDLVAELCAGMIGGPAVAPGAPLRRTAAPRVAVLEATHSTAQRLCWANRAKPLRAALPGDILLRRLGDSRAADALEAAVVEVLRDG